jgi:hypothetical protein
VRTDTDVEVIKPVRYERKVWDGRGLYLLVTPKGGRCWRYAYRFSGKYKKLALGTYPVVTLELARSRHEFARNMLAHGVDPAALKAAIGKRAFAAMMREWAKARGDISAAIESQDASKRPTQTDGKITDIDWCGDTISPTGGTGYGG